MSLVEGDDGDVRAGLPLSFVDNNDGGTEVVSIDLDGYASSTQTITSGNVVFTTTYSLSSSLLNDGLLDISLERVRGSFAFLDSYLYVSAWRSETDSGGGVVTIPEPSTLFLFGVGLFGLGIVRWWRRAR